MRQPKMHSTTPSRNRQNCRAAISRLGDIITANFEGNGYWYTLLMNKSDKLYVHGDFSRNFAKMFAQYITRGINSHVPGAQYVYCIEPRTKRGVIAHYISNVPPETLCKVFDRNPAVVEYKVVQQIAPGDGRSIAQHVTSFASDGAWRYAGGRGERLYTASYNLIRC